MAADGTGANASVLQGEVICRYASTDDGRSNYRTQVACVVAGGGKAFGRLAALALPTEMTLALDGAGLHVQVGDDDNAVSAMPLFFPRAILESPTTDPTARGSGNEAPGATLVHTGLAWCSTRRDGEGAGAREMTVCVSEKGGVAKIALRHPSAVLVLALAKTQEPPTFEEIVAAAHESTASVSVLGPISKLEFAASEFVCYPDDLDRFDCALVPVGIGSIGCRLVLTHERRSWRVQKAYVPMD